MRQDLQLAGQVRGGLRRPLRGGGSPRGGSLRGGTKCSGRITRWGGSPRGGSLGGEGVLGADHSVGEEPPGDHSVGGGTLGAGSLVAGTGICLRVSFAASYVTSNGSEIDMSCVALSTSSNA